MRVMTEHFVMRTIYHIELVLVLCLAVSRSGRVSSSQIALAAEVLETGLIACVDFQDTLCARNEE